MSVISTQPFRLRSFVRRDSRITASQERAFQEYWPQIGLPMDQLITNFSEFFANPQPTFIEVGFGNGQSLLALAKTYPDFNFIGVETHKPGIGSLLLGMKKEKITNLRLFYGDVVDVFKNCIANNMVSGIQIFFPDPWPKRRHLERRLIQEEFLQLVVLKLQVNGSLHLATDWQDYASHMMQVAGRISPLQNCFGPNQFATRSPYRPILTKFEQRALKEDRKIWDLQFKKIQNG